MRRALCYRDLCTVAADIDSCTSHHFCLCCRLRLLLYCRRVRLCCRLLLPRLCRWLLLYCRRIRLFCRLLQLYRLPSLCCLLLQLHCLLLLRNLPSSCGVSLSCHRHAPLSVLKQIAAFAQSVTLSHCMEGASSLYGPSFIAPH